MVAVLQHRADSAEVDFGAFLIPSKSQLDQPHRDASPRHMRLDAQPVLLI